MFENLFRDPRFQRFRSEKAAPHAVYVAEINGGKVAALVLRRNRSDGDWALSRSALQYFSEALRDERIAEGHIVLADKWAVSAHASVEKVVAQIGDAEPNDGPWGAYWWLSSALKPVTDYRKRIDDSEPF
jgi:hypothetical protein